MNEPLTEKDVLFQLLKNGNCTQSPCSRCPFFTDRIESPCKINAQLRNKFPLDLENCVSGTELKQIVIEKIIEDYGVESLVEELL